MELLSGQYLKLEGGISLYGNYSLYGYVNDTLNGQYVSNEQWVYVSTSTTTTLAHNWNISSAWEFKPLENVSFKFIDYTVVSNLSGVDRIVTNTSGGVFRLYAYTVGRTNITINNLSVYIINFTLNSESSSINYNLSALGASADIQYYANNSLIFRIPSDTAGAFNLTSTDLGTTQRGHVFVYNPYTCNITNYTLSNSNKVVQIYMNNTNWNTCFTCTLNNLDNWCNYGGTNLTSILIPANYTTSYDFCTIKGWTTNLYVGSTVSIYISEDEYLNKSNLGTLNGSQVITFRRYYNV